MNVQELKRLTAKCGGAILYQPLKGEIDYTDPWFPLELSANRITVPNNKQADPFLWLDKCRRQFKHSKPCILVPGSKFDWSGARQGRGGGWYDRFLSLAPRSWLRIGLVESGTINARLAVRAWDEPVDWLIWFDGVWRAHQTDARL